MIEIVAYPAEPLAAKLQVILARRLGAPPQIEQRVREILQQVRQGGDQALAELTRQIERVELTPGQYRAPREALARAAAALDPGLRAAMEEAVANIRAFHDRQRLNSWFVEEGDGVILGKKVTPVRRVGKDAGFQRWGWHAVSQWPC